MTVTIDDVAGTLGRATPLPGTLLAAQWQRWIQNALLLLRTGDGVHEGLGDLCQLDQETLDYVVTEAVAAMARRPDDSTSVEIAVDDGRVSRTYQSGTGRVAIRDEWWNQLRPAVATGAFSFRPTFEPDRPPVPYCRAW